MKLLRFLMVFILCFTLVGCQQDVSNSSNTTNTSQSSNIDDGRDKGFSLDEVPEYPGEPVVALYNNVPDFLFIHPLGFILLILPLFSVGIRSLPILAYATPHLPKLSRSLYVSKDFVVLSLSSKSGTLLYNRCHLIGHQLAGEDANEKNLITGTRYFNVEGMLPFENIVADYVKETNNHVLYRVTPVYDGNDLVAKGVQMEAYSVEDDGEGVLFNVFVYNVQPGITIDYATGNSEQDAINAGYRKAKR